MPDLVFVEKDDIDTYLFSYDGCIIEVWISGMGDWCSFMYRRGRDPGHDVGVAPPQPIADRAMLLAQTLHLAGD
jgi:hypothetical protein